MLSRHISVHLSPRPDLYKRRAPLYEPSLECCKVLANLMAQILNLGTVNQTDDGVTINPASDVLDLLHHRLLGKWRLQLVASVQVATQAPAGPHG